MLFYMKIFFLTKITWFQRETYFTLYTVGDDVQLRSTAESPVENKILPDNSSRIIPVTVNDYSSIPLNNTSPEEPPEPLSENLIIDKAPPITTYSLYLFVYLLAKC